MNSHPIPFAIMPASPEGSASTWLSKIRSYAALRGEVGTTDPVQISCGVFGQFMSSGGGAVELPRAPSTLSVSALVENASTRPSVSLNLQFKLAFSNPNNHYILSDLRFASNIPSGQILKVERIEIGLGHSSATAAAILSGPFEVNFNGSGAPTALTPAAPSVQIPAQLDLASTCAGGIPTSAAYDGITFEFRGLSWADAPAPTPSPSASTSVASYQSIRREGAMRVLIKKCSGCHGLGGNSGGVFPKAAEMLAGTYQAITDSDWSAYWVVSGSPSTSRLMTRLQAVANGGPQLAGVQRTMPLNRGAISLQDVYALNDWILLMGSDDAKTFRFEIPTGNSVSALGDWNTVSQPIRLKVGDKLFVRNLDTAAHSIHANNRRPFPHQAGSTAACGAASPCGSTVFTAINPANSIPMQGSDAIYDHLFRDNMGRKFNIYMAVTP